MSGTITTAFDSNVNVAESMDGVNTREQQQKETKSGSS